MVYINKETQEHIKTPNPTKKKMYRCPQKNPDPNTQESLIWRQHKNTAATNLELLNLVLVKHGEDVAGGALGPLLRGATTAGGLTGGHDFCKAFLISMHPQIKSYKS